MTVYIGRPGAMVALRSPRANIPAKVVRPARIRETLGGGRAVDYAPGVLRTWELSWGALSHDDQALIMEFWAGHRGPGPYAFLDGAERNLLTRNQSATTSVYNDTSGFSTAGAGETIASSSTTVERGPRVLAWSLPASVTGGILTLNGPNLDWPGIPCVPGQSYRLQARVRGSGPDGVVDVTAKLRWLNAAGAQVQLDAGSAVTTSTSAWADCVKASTVCPAGGVYLQPRFDVAAGTVSAAATVLIDRLMVSMPTALDPGTTWVPGLGVARVSLPQLDHELPRIDRHNLKITVTEVA
ncbi:hypothetical protein [Dactylosporangium sp. NPDC000521]|uniref:hypothetical protein n=1 Tax=Dactylosporangium sp. NPDC000521 TaxID=3363975 RepID=UPI00369A9180